MRKLIQNIVCFWSLKYFKKEILNSIDVSELQINVCERYQEHNKDEHEARISSVRDFLDSTLPTLDPRYRGVPICEGGKYNWLLLPSGENVLVDFFVPSLALFICIPDIRSASWEEARMRGVTRKMWESMQEDLEYIKSTLPQIPTLGSNTRPNIIILNWGDSVNHHKLKSLIFSDVSS